MSSTAVEPRSTPLVPLDTEQTRAAMAKYQEGLQAILDESDRQRFVTRDGEARDFVKRSGWRKISTWFSLNLEIRSEEVERDKNDNPTRARVIARAIAPNGRYAEGEGGCSLRERNFAKPEHDLVATAGTRAMNRAISNLVGMGEVSAEEVDGAEPSVSNPFGRAATESMAAEAFAQLDEQLPNHGILEFRRVLGNAMGEPLPEASVRALKGVAWWLSQAVMPEEEVAPEAGAENESEE
jgi:hypothetical protein